MVKIIGLLLLVAAGTFLGYRAAAGLSRRADSLDKAQRLLAHLASRMRYTAAPVDELLAQAAATAEFAALPFLQAAARAAGTEEGFHAAWNEGVADYGKACGFTESDLELLRSFGEGLGRTDLEGQLDNCRMYAAQLGDRLAEARREAAAKSRLYLTLGVTGGMALALLLL